MRQADMELLLAKDEYEVRSYFLCGSSARTNSIDGTTMYLTNKRLILEFMNNYEVSRREIPIDQVLFVKSHYYEEQEDPSYAIKCRNWGIVSFVLASIFVILGVLALVNIFNIFALVGLSISWLPFILVGVGVALCLVGGILLDRSKKFWPRVGKKLELLIGTTLDFDRGLTFTTDSTQKLRDNMRTYGGTRFNSLIGRVELSPTREAKKMINEIGALIIDIKAGLFNEDPAIKEKREKEEKAKREEKERQEIEKKQQEEFEKRRAESIKIPKGKEDIAKSDRKVSSSGKKETSEEREQRERRERREERERKQQNDSRILSQKNNRQENMSKYGAPLTEERSKTGLPSNIEMQLQKSKIKVPDKVPVVSKSEDELLEEEYMSVIQSLNLE